MNKSEIREYIAGHIELVAETLLSECEDWRKIRLRPDSMGVVQNVQPAPEKNEEWVDRRRLSIARKRGLEDVKRALAELSWVVPIQHEDDILFLGAGGNEILEIKL